MYCNWYVVCLCVGMMEIQVILLTDPTWGRGSGSMTKQPSLILDPAAAEDQLAHFFHLPIISSLPGPSLKIHPRSASVTVIVTTINTYHREQNRRETSFISLLHPRPYSHCGHQSFPVRVGATRGSYSIQVRTKRRNSARRL